MPYKYGNAPGLLQETISKITYKSEYTTSFTGERVPLQNVRIPTGLKMRTAWDEARTPETSRAIQLPFHHRRNYPARINLQGLQPSPTARARSALQRPSSNASQISRSSGRRPTSSVSALGTFCITFFMGNCKPQTAKCHVTTALRSRLQFAVHVWTAGRASSKVFLPQKIVQPRV